MCDFTPLCDGRSRVRSAQRAEEETGIIEKLSVWLFLNFAGWFLGPKALQNGVLSLKQSSEKLFFFFTPVFYSTWATDFMIVYVSELMTTQGRIQLHINNTVTSQIFGTKTQ